MPRMTPAEVIVYQARMASKWGENNPHVTSDQDDESKFHEEIMTFLKRAGIHGVVHSRMDKATTQQCGVPDFLFAYSGVPIALEAKVKNRKVTPEQAGWLTALGMDGWLCRVVRSLSDVAEALEAARAKHLT